MQPSYGMGDLVGTLWEMHEPDAHFNGYRLALYHPEHGLLITEDIDWFLVRRVAFIPASDRAQLAAASPLPASEMLFHVSGDEIWTPFQMSRTLPVEAGTDKVASLSLPDPMSQAALAAYADRWADALHGAQWLTQAVKYPSDLAAKIQTRPQWQPDASTLKHWITSSNRCEAAEVA